MSERKASRRCTLLTGALAAMIAASAVGAATPVPAPIQGEAAGVADGAPLTGEPGEAARGRTIVLDRNLSGCILCHTLPDADVAGDLGPSLAGVGSRFSVRELRARLVDSSRYNPDTIMPAYYRSTGLNRVAPAYRDKTVLSAQQIEDVVAYLRTLK